MGFLVVKAMCPPAAYLDSLVPAACGQQTLVVGMPVAGEDRSAVSRELALALVRAPQVPQLHVAVLLDGHKHIVVVGAELHASHTLRRAVRQMTVLHHYRTVPTTKLLET